VRLPYSWLKELLPEAPPVEVVAETLPQLGLGVEAVRQLPSAPDGVVVVRVDGVKPLAGSDTLMVCQVSTDEARYQVVCGAPNVTPGMLTAYAGVGVTLPAVGVTLAEKVVQGVGSQGMLCSPRELGLYDYAGGLIHFGEDVAPGELLSERWGSEVVLELELTPNRADAFSLLGVARDLAAKLGVAYRHPAADAPLADPRCDDGLRVEVADAGACPRFTLRRIDGVTVGPSPIWLQRRLAALGLRPRNNVVDVTNYLTFELGQPSHAYDLAKLQGGAIVVRSARVGERLRTLTDAVLELSDDDLLITTPDGAEGKPIGLAGVIGGLEDSIGPATTSVALEVAHFDPVTVRRSAKRHGLATDAHYRFERGVDPNLPPIASARAAQLIAELTGGTPHPGITAVGQDAPPRVVPFRPSRVAFLTALEVPQAAQQRFLEALGCQVARRNEDDWLVTVPSWRFDLTIEEDLIEEVARLYGYDQITESVPTMYFVPEEADRTHKRLRSLLAGVGFQEAMSYVFSSPQELTRAGAPEAVVALQNPQGQERSVLRTALYPGLLAAAQTNHQLSSLALFEIGRVFTATEQERLGLLLQGEWLSSSWQPPVPVNFYLFKGILEKLAQMMGVSLRCEPTRAPFLHPGVAARVIWDGADIGVMGRLHPEVAARYELGEVYLAELELPLAARQPTFVDFARQPYAERDLAVIVPEALTFAELAELMTANAGAWLESLAPFDVYQGEPVPTGAKSIALRLRFRHPERSLADSEVDASMANIIKRLNEAGYTVRDK
jgi:phenylalanyl-tRNA synthetase beta chain